MKKILIIGSLIAGITLYSCGGSSSSSEDNQGSGVVSNTVIPPTTMDGKPFPSEKPIPSENPAKDESGIDVNAKSDDKGVGKFKEVKLGASVDPAMAAKGKELFQTYCTACHTATDKRLIGPGLLGITKIRTPEWIMNQIDDPVKMSQNDPLTKALLAAYNNVQMTDQGTTEEETRAILEFFRQNDGVK